MAFQPITIGTADAKAGDTLFSGATKINANFAELYGASPNNIVVINDVTDFPAASGGIITLDDNTTYYISDNIVTADRFVCGQNNIITSNNPFANALVYTGSGDMFTGVNVSFAVDRGVISCPNAQPFNFSATAGNLPTFGLNLTTIANCQKCGTFDNLRSVNVTNTAFFDCTEGISISGVDNWDTFTVSRLRIDGGVSVINGLDLTSSLHETFELSNYVIIGGAGTIGITGLPNNANVKPNFIASIDQCEFTSGVTPLSGITIEDVRFSFLSNSGLQDSTIDANPYLSVATTVTINTSGVYEKINQGNWLFSEASRLSVSTDGDVTNLMEKPVKLQINGSVTLEKVGGGSDLLTARLVYNDLPNDPQSVITELGTDNTNPTNIGLVGIFTLNPGDAISIYVSNQDSTANVIVNYAKFALLRVL
tara:strand:- start:1754 stop:3025 length:1272 start_codon:yes stop_codon:yes gene_type:complete